MRRLLNMRSFLRASVGILVGKETVIELFGGLTADDLETLALIESELAPPDPKE